jgi:hypothetical protein
MGRSGDELRLPSPIPFSPVSLSPRLPVSVSLLLRISPSARPARHPFTQTTCLISATTSTKSSWFFMTVSIDL